MAVTQFDLLANGVSTVLRLPHVAGDGVLSVLSTADFVAPTRVTCYTGTGPLSEKRLCILAVTAINHETRQLIVGGAVEGTADVSLNAGVRCEIRGTAGQYNQLTGAINAIQATSVATLSAAAPLAYDPASNTFSLPGDIPQAQVAGLVSALAGKAATVHAHAIADTTGLQTALDLKAAASGLAAHVADAANPHGVTKAQVGLGNVPNADATARANHTGTQAASTVSDFAEAVDDRVSALLVAGSGVTLTYDDGANTITVASSGGAGSSLPIAMTDGSAHTLFRFDADTDGGNVGDPMFAMKTASGQARFLVNAFGITVYHAAGLSFGALGRPTLKGSGLFLYDDVHVHGASTSQMKWTNFGDTYTGYDAGIGRFGPAATRSTDGSSGFGDHKARTVFGRRDAEPADSELVAGEYCDWMDATPGAAKWKFKAKDSAGTVVRGEIALS